MSVRLNIPISDILEKDRISISINNDAVTKENVLSPIVVALDANISLENLVFILFFSHGLCYISVDYSPIYIAHHRRTFLHIRKCVFHSPYSLLSVWH